MLGLAPALGLITTHRITNIIRKGERPSQACPPNLGLVNPLSTLIHSYLLWQVLVVKLLSSGQLSDLHNNFVLS